MADDERTVLVVHGQRSHAEVGEVHPALGPLRDMVATARSRLAEIEANYAGDRRAVEATRAKLFNQVKQHYQARDRLRSIIRDRRKCLEALLAGLKHEAAGEHQRARTETASNDERTTSATECRELGDESEREIRKLWKKLILRYHPDRHAGETEIVDTYVQLSSTINRAKEDRDIGRLREIYDDPEGFALRQGWTWLGFNDADEITSLPKLLGTIYAEIVNKLRALNGLRESPLYELHLLGSGRPDLLDEVASGVAKAISAETAQLETQAEKLESEIAELTGSGEASNSA